MDRRIVFCIYSNIQFFQWKVFKTFRTSTFFCTSLYTTSLFAVSCQVLCQNPLSLTPLYPTLSTSLCPLTPLFHLSPLSTLDNRLSLSLHIYVYMYTGCPRRNVPDFARVFLMLKYTDITQNTYIQS